MFNDRRLSVNEQDELDRLKAHYPDPKDSPLAKTITLRLGELHQRSK
jgi:hypothetical protein